MELLEKSYGWLMPASPDDNNSKHGVTRHGLSNVLSTLEQYADPAGHNVDNIKMTLYSFLRAMEDCGLHKFKHNVEASVWAKHQDMQRRIPIQYIATRLVEEIAADHIWWRRGSVGPTPAKYDQEVANVANLIWRRLANKPKKVEPEVQVPGVFERLTDEGRYPFIHKQKLSELTVSQRRSESASPSRRRSLSVRPSDVSISSAQSSPLVRVRTPSVRSQRKKPWRPWRTHPAYLI